jgi:hypothetical protein
MFIHGDPLTPLSARELVVPQYVLRENPLIFEV